MKKLRERLKKIIIDNVIVGFVAFLIMTGICFIIENGILMELKSLWFTLLFISLSVFLYNVVALMKVPHLGKRFTDEWNHTFRK